MDYDEDDLYDEEGAGEGFNEDNLNDEEYNKLYNALPELQRMTAGKFKGLTNDDLKELLWNNYFSVDDTLEEIKQEYKRKCEAAAPVEVAAKPASKLGALAKQKGRVGALSKGGGLSGLMKRRGEKKGTGLSALEQAMKKRRLQGSEPKETEGSDAKSSGGLAALMRGRKKNARTKDTAIERPEQTKAPAEPVVPSFPSFTQPAHSSSASLITQTPPSLLTRLIFSPAKQPTLSAQFNLFDFFTNNTDTARKAVQNFQAPSPDDKQKKVDEITDKVSKVKLAPAAASANKSTKPKKKIDVDAEIAKKAAKPSLAFVVIGHIDSGKSTMVGRMLYDLKIVDSKTMHRLTRESENIGKASFSLAWIMDQTEEERSRGITVDICETQFETPTSRFTAIDCPGHKDYVPQMINGVTQADVAVVIIDVVSFESGFSNNGQTKEHLTIAKSLGIERCIIAVNKMDAVQWEETRFETVKDQLTDYLVDELKFQDENLTFVPTSGYDGDNVVKKSTSADWYKQGDTLIERLELESKRENHTFDKNSRFILTVNDVQTSGKTGELTASGRIASGMVQPGETVIVSPSGESGVVEAISTTAANVGSSAVKKLPQDVALEGEFVELKLRKMDNPDNVKIGDIATKYGDEVPPVKKFTCQLDCFALDRPLLVGTPFILFRGNVSLPARLSTIREIVSNGKVKKRKHMASGNSGLVDIEIREQPVPMLTFEQNSKLGRVVLRRDGKTIAAGTVTATIKL